MAGVEIQRSGSGGLERQSPEPQSQEEGTRYTIASLFPGVSVKGKRGRTERD